MPRSRAAVTMPIKPNRAQPAHEPRSRVWAVPASCLKAWGRRAPGGSAQKRANLKHVGPMPKATRCPLPSRSRLRDSLLRIDYLDSFEVPSRTPEQNVVLIYAASFGHLPKGFKRLLVLRSHLVKPFGIAGVSYADLARSIDIGRNYAVGDRIGRWTLFAKHQDEL